MRKTKIWAAAPVRTPLAVQRAAAGPAPKPAAPAPAPTAARKPLPAVGVSETNSSAEYVAAAMVPHGKPAPSGRVELVSPGGTIAPPSGFDLRAFIHRDGSAVKFAGAAGAVHLEVGETRAEFGPLVGQAQTLLQSRAPASQTPAPAAKPATTAHREKSSESNAVSSAPAKSVQSALQSSSGRPLPESSRARLESSFGTDLSGVRVHTDATADTAARALNANAFATGQDVFFRAGKYQPETADGQKLIAHETAHTVQQSAASTLPATQTASAELAISEPGDRSEREAVAAAERAVAGRPAPIQPLNGGRATPLARLASGPAADFQQKAAPESGAVTPSLKSVSPAAAPPPAGNSGGNPAGGSNGSPPPAHSAGGPRTYSYPALASRNWRLQRSKAPGPDHFEREAHRAALFAQRGDRFPVTERTGRLAVQADGELSGIVKSALDFIAPKANAIAGFRMFTIVLGENPINMSPVDRSPVNVLRAVIEFMPAGALIEQALDRYGIIDKVGNWIAEKLKALSLVGGAIADALVAFAKSLDASDVLLHPAETWERAKRIFTEPIDRIIDFVKGVATDVVGLIKDAVLLPLAKLAEGTRGWDLLIAVLGKNPVTGEAVPRTAETLIPGFLKLIGQEEIWENMKKAKALDRAWAWFQGALKSLMGFVNQIPALATAAFKSLEIEDLVILPNAFAKVGAVFGNFIGDFIDWAGTAVWSLLEIIFDVVSPGALAYIKKTGAALKGILKDPLPFVGNLVKAAKLGFENFGANFGAHLKAGLLDWLTGSLPGVYIPKALSLLEIGKFALSVLGVSWGQIRGKIVKALGPNGEMIMKGLETTFDVVKALVTGGPAAAWEIIKEKLTDLKDTVISGIISFVEDAVIKKAIPKLISMFVPGAGFISAIISIYDTVMVFVEKISKLVQVVKGFIDSIVAIAGGEIGGAAARVEGILGNLLSLAINFLAGFVGLNDVAEKVLGVVAKIRASVDKALDTAIAWIIEKAKALFAKLFGKKDEKDDRTLEQKEKDLRAAVTEGTALLQDKSMPLSEVKKKLNAIRKTYRVTTLEVVVDSEVDGEEKVHIHGEINPDLNGDEVEKKGKSYLGCHKSGDTFEGSFDLPDWEKGGWTNYPQHQVDRHPANEFLNYQNNTPVSRPRGEFTVGDATGGAPADIKETWWTKITAEKEAVKQELLKQPGTGKGDAENQAQKAIVQKYRDAGWTAIEHWMDLYLLKGYWEGHHIKPVNWSGTDDRDNLQYLRNAQHAPFKEWFEAKKKEILKELNKPDQEGTT